MIKWDGFGKLLKQGFFILLISCFILLGGSFVSAETIGNELPYGFYMDNIYNTIDKNLNFENSENGNRLLKKYSNGAKRTILWNNGRLYTYFYENQNSNYQGFFNKACKIYSETGTIEFQGPLCNNTTDYTEEIINEFYNLINYNFTYTITPNFSNWNYYSPTLCFYNANNKYYYCMSLQFLEGSNLEIPNNTTDFTEYAENSPFWYGQGGSQGSVDIGQGIDTLSGDFVYSTCSYGEIINMLNSQGFSPYMCYGGIDNFDSFDPNLSYSPMPGTGLKLSQILVNAMNGPWDTPQEWFDFWNGLYNDKKDTTYSSLWSSYPAIYRTWFDLYYQYSDGTKYFDSVREYCSLIDLDIDTTTTYRGQYFKGVCDTINDQRQFSYTFGGSGEVGLGVNWGLSGEKVQSNGVQFIQDFFNKAQEVIPTNYSDIGLGFLPVYIITFMIALIFFRFLMH